MRTEQRADLSYRINVNHNENVDKNNSYTMNVRATDQHIHVNILRRTRQIRKDRFCVHLSDTYSL
jgi:hypothetical protein